MGMYLHLFETENDFNDAYNGTAYTEPWVSYTKQEDRVDYNKSDEPTPADVWLDLTGVNYPSWDTEDIFSLMPSDFPTESECPVLVKEPDGRVMEYYWEWEGDPGDGTYGDYYRALTSEDQGKFPSTEGLAKLSGDINGEYFTWKYAGNAL